MLDIPEHRFGKNQQYHVRRFTINGRSRIAERYAQLLQHDGILPSLLQSVDGDGRYWKAVLEECLVEAPARWWHCDAHGKRTPDAEGNRLAFEVYPEEFAYVTGEVQRWLDSFQDVTEFAGDVDAGAPDADAVAVGATVPAAFTGKAF